MNMMQILWLVLILVFALAEGLTEAVVSAWFCLGAIVAMVVALILPGATVAQVVVFFVVSIIALAALRPTAKRLLAIRRTPTNADANIGKTGQVVNEVQPSRFGRVKLEGLEWTAKSDYVLPVGAWVRVNAIEGVKLVVSPLQEAAPAQPAPQASEE